MISRNFSFFAHSVKKKEKRSLCQADFFLVNLEYSFIGSKNVNFTEFLQQHGCITEWNDFTKVFLWEGISWSYITVWKFGDFKATLILWEINFCWFQKVKNCQLENFENFKFENFTHENVKKPLKIQNAELLKLSKWQFWGL